MMMWQAWLTLIVLGGVLVALAKERFPPSAAIIGGTVLLMVTGVINPDQAFSGFSNPAPITVAALYVLARAVEKTGALQPLVASTLGAGTSVRHSLARLLFPAAAASAFLNNTPIVAMLVPQISEWAHQRGRSPSWYLMPLSYAAILGGMVTAIGTSTNLVVSGMLEAAGHPPLSMFELAKIGLPVAVIGVVYLIVVTPWLLSERRPARVQAGDEYREFVVTMAVEPGGPLEGMAVENAGLRHLQGVFLVEISRAGEVIGPVGPTTVMRGGDELTFVGKVDLIVDLQSKRGLVSTEQQHLAEFDTHRHTFFEAVIGPASPLVGKTLREVEFRGRFQAAAVAIHRAGQRLSVKLGTVRLRTGDTLLLLTDRDFGSRWRDRNVFLLASQIGGSPPSVTRKAWVVGVIAAVIVVGAAVGALPILHLSLIGALALVGFGVLTPGEARAAVDLDVILVIAGAFGLGAALEVSGVAQGVANVLVNGFGDWGATAVLVGLVLATLVLKSVISNNATAVLMFPIAVAAAVDLGVEPRAFAVAVAIASSAAFLTPIGYQTNLMVYGPGGYHFADYPRLGAGLTVIVLIAVAVMVPRLWTG